MASFQEILHTCTSRLTLKAKVRTVYYIYLPLPSGVTELLALHESSPLWYLSRAALTVSSCIAVFFPTPVILIAGDELYSGALPTRLTDKNTDADESYSLPVQPTGNPTDDPYSLLALMAKFCTPEALDCSTLFNHVLILESLAGSSIVSSDISLVTRAR